MKLQMKLRVSLVVVAAIVFAGAFPAIGYAKEYRDFIIKDGVLTDYVGQDSKITIPSNVKEIRSCAFHGNSILEEVTIPGNVKVIGSDTFSECNHLKTVIMEKGVETIDTHAFGEDSNLTTVTIPETVVRIKEGNFRESKWIKNDIQEFMLAGNGILIDYKGKSSKVTLPANVRAIGSDAFQNSKNDLTQIIMDKGLKKICNNAFADFSKLKVVSIPESVTYIGEGAFVGTLWLENNKKDLIVAGDGILIKYQGKQSRVVLESNIKHVNERTFENNNKLCEVVFSKNIKEIKEGAFQNCKNLRRVNIPSGLQTIGSYSFYESGITSIHIPGSVKSIGENAFCKCKKLLQVSYEKNSNIKSIEAGTFRRCTSLKKAVLPNKLTKLSEEAFSYCNKLQSINLPDTLTEIGDSTFIDCQSLSSVTIPKKVTHLPNLLFEECTSLRKVSLQGKVTAIGDFAFSDCKKLSDFTMPSSVKELGYSAFSGCYLLKQISLNTNIIILPQKCFENCKNLAKITMKNDKIFIEADALSGTEWLKNYSGDFVIKNGRLLYYKGTGNTVKIPDTVDTIANGSFTRNPKVAEVILPMSVKKIEGDAFANCDNLKKVVLPKSIELIDKEAFCDCVSLKEVSLNDSEANSSNAGAVLGENAFAGCYKLNKITLPDNITDMKEFAFSNCTSLSEIQLPKKLENIGDRAFEKCTNLSKISFDGTIKSIGREVFLSTPFINQTNEKLVVLQNVLLAYRGNDKSVTIPDTCTIIAENAFKENMDLEEIKLPNKLQYIGVMALGNCKNLKTVSMPSTKFTVDNYAFAGTPWLSDQKDEFVILPNGILLRYQGDEKTVTIPDTVTEMAPGAFQDTSIEKVIIPGSVKKICNNAFDFSAVKEIDISEGVEEIGDKAFEECRNLKLIRIPDSVKKIGYNLVFCEEENLTYIIECRRGSKAYEYAVSENARIRETE